MSEAVTIGTAQTGDVALDVGALVGSHLGIVANSGGGKSGLLRKVLEATHGQIQHIILDSEDEFYTLRERFEYVIAGGEGGDAPAKPANAAELAVTALTHGFSLICQINDLGRDGAVEFVDRFLAAMISAPRELWRPCLIVIDEAQRFPPETLQQLTEAGRKRGFTAVIATQRLPKLNANIRGDINNWMMGRVGQALDKRHIADQLGMTPTQMRDALDLPPRCFWAFGPAIAREPVLFRVGDVETTMLRPGGLRPTTPPPPEALREIMAGLKVPEAADDTAQTSENYSGSIPEAIRERDQRIAELETQIGVFAIERAVGQQQIDDLIVERDGLRAAIAGFNAAIGKVPVAAHDEPRLDLPMPSTCAPDAAVVAPTPKHVPAPRKQGVGPDDLTNGARKMVDTLAKYHPRGLPEQQLAAIAKVSTKSSLWPTNWSSFQNCTLVQHVGGLWRLNEQGIAHYGVEGQPDDPDAILRFWQSALLPSVGKMLGVIAAAKGKWLDRDTIADHAGISRTSSGLGSGLKELRDNGLILGDGKTFRAAEVLL